MIIQILYIALCIVGGSFCLEELPQKFHIPDVASHATIEYKEGVTQGPISIQGIIKKIYKDSLSQYLTSLIDPNTHNNVQYKKQRTSDSVNAKPGSDIQHTSTLYPTDSRDLPEPSETPSKEFPILEDDFPKPHLKQSKIYAALKKGHKPHGATTEIKFNRKLPGIVTQLMKKSTENEEAAIPDLDLEFFDFGTFEPMPPTQPYKQANQTPSKIFSQNRVNDDINKGTTESSIHKVKESTNAFGVVNDAEVSKKLHINLVPTRDEREYLRKKLENWRVFSMEPYQLTTELPLEMVTLNKEYNSDHRTIESLTPNGKTFPASEQVTDKTETDSKPISSEVISSNHEITTPLPELENLILDETSLGNFLYSRDSKNSKNLELANSVESTTLKVPPKPANELKSQIVNENYDNDNNNLVKNISPMSDEKFVQTSESIKDPKGSDRKKCFKHGPTLRNSTNFINQLPLHKITSLIKKLEFGNKIKQVQMPTERESRRLAIFLFLNPRHNANNFDSRSAKMGKNFEGSISEEGVHKKCHSPLHHTDQVSIEDTVSHNDEGSSNPTINPLSMLLRKIYRHKLHLEKKDVSKGWDNINPFTYKKSAGHPKEFNLTLNPSSNSENKILLNENVSTPKNKDALSKQCKKKRINTLSRKILEKILSLVRKSKSNKCRCGASRNPLNQTTYFEEKNKADELMNLPVRKFQDALKEKITSQPSTFSVKTILVNLKYGKKSGASLYHINKNLLNENVSSSENTDALSKQYKKKRINILSRKILEKILSLVRKSKSKKCRCGTSRNPLNQMTYFEEKNKADEPVDLPVREFQDTLKKKITSQHSTYSVKTIQVNLKHGKKSGASLYHINKKKLINVFHIKPSLRTLVKYNIETESRLRMHSGKGIQEVSGSKSLDSQKPIYDFHSTPLVKLIIKGHTKTKERLQKRSMKDTAEVSNVAGPDSKNPIAVFYANPLVKVTVKSTFDTALSSSNNSQEQITEFYTKPLMKVTVEGQTKSEKRLQKHSMKDIKGVKDSEDPDSKRSISVFYTKPLMKITEKDNTETKTGQQMRSEEDFKEALHSANPYSKEPSGVFHTKPSVKVIVEDYTKTERHYKRVL